jgi:hypothetical protein
LGRAGPPAAVRARSARLGACHPCSRREVHHARATRQALPPHPPPCPLECWHRCRGAGLRLGCVGTSVERRGAEYRAFKRGLADQLLSETLGACFCGMHGSPAVLGGLRPGGLSFSDGHREPKERRFLLLVTNPKHEQAGIKPKRKPPTTNALSSRQLTQPQTPTAAVICPEVLAHAEVVNVATPSPRGAWSAAAVRSWHVRASARAARARLLMRLRPPAQNGETPLLVPAAAGESTQSKHMNGASQGLPRHFQGACYGLAHTPAAAAARHDGALGTRTELPGLYLTGGRQGLRRTASFSSAQRRAPPKAAHAKLRAR